MKRTERQAHGFIFQDWVVGKFLDMAYTADWDIPKKINHITNKNVSIKTSLWKSGGVGLGDILNQFNINDDFQMLVAFYEIIKDRKKVVNIQLVTISKDKWREMWGNLKEEDLYKFIGLVKSSHGKNLSGQELDDFRENIQKEKKEIFKDYDGKFSIHPKIDSKKQRRVQCSLPFNTFFREFNIENEKMETYNFWGKEIKLSSIKLD